MKKKRGRREAPERGKFREGEWSGEGNQKKRVGKEPRKGAKTILGGLLTQAPSRGK